MISSAMTIAGSDCSGGAGIQADIKTFEAHSVFGTSVITAVTSQNTQGVYDIQKIDTHIVAGQLNSILADIPVKSIKTGMLFSADTIDAVKEVLTNKAKNIPLIVDPVMASTGQDILIQDDAKSALLAFLEIALLITPNLPEAEKILGDSISNLEDMKRAARELGKRYRSAILLKGGHQKEEVQSEYVVDVFYTNESYDTELIRFPRIETRNTHGTGCTLSASIAACLANGHDLKHSVFLAREYLQNSIQFAPGLGSGKGPLNHFWKNEKRKPYPESTLQLEKEKIS